MRLSEIPLIDGKLPLWMDEAKALMFCSKIEKNENSGCWNWTAGTFKSGGYGAFSMFGQAQRAHVVMFQLCVRMPLSGEKVLHKCDNPLCVNPLHLKIGTQVDNLRDMVKRGRHWRGATKILTPDEVREIRKLALAGVCYNEIVEKFGVGKCTISEIKTGQRWKEIV